MGAMLTAGAGVIAFGPRGSSQAPEGRVVLDYWEKWTGQEGDAMRRIVDRFNRAQDRIWVRYLSVSAIEQKTVIAVAANSPPDLVGLWTFSLPAFVSSNALIPIEELDESFGAQAESDLRSWFAEPVARPSPEHYTPPVWRMQRYRGVMGGFVNTCSTLALYYNRAMFRDVGLDPDRPPRTIQELDDVADQLTTYRADGSVDRAGFLHREPGWWNWLWGTPFGGDIFDEKTEICTCASDENVRGYEWLQSYPERYGPSRLVAFQSGFGGYNTTQQPLLAGKVAMAYHGPFLANVLGTFAPDFDYGAAPFPMDESVFDPDRPIALLESDMLAIPRGCKHPAEAYTFALYTQQQRQTEQLAIAHAKPSPLARTSPDFAHRHPNRFISMHNRLAASERAFLKPATRAWPQYEGEFNAEIGTFWELSRPARDILIDMQRRGQDAVDKVAARRRLRQQA